MTTKRWNCRTLEFDWLGDGKVQRAIVLGPDAPSADDDEPSHVYFVTPEDGENESVTFQKQSVDAKLVKRAAGGGAPSGAPPSAAVGAATGAGNIAIVDHDDTAITNKEYRYHFTLSDTTSRTAALTRSDSSLWWRHYSYHPLSFPRTTLILSP